MHTLITRPLVPALLLGWVALAAPARADVIDKGEFFSADAVKKANQRIDEVKRKHKRDLVIETSKEVPDDIRDEYKKDKEKKDRNALRPLFSHWAEKRAKGLDVNGVYIFLCKEASWLQIEIRNDTKKHAFTEDDRGRLRERMETLLKEKDFDAALAEAVDRVTTAYENHDKGEPNKRGQGGGIGGGIGGWICIGLCVLLGVWLIIGLMRGMSGGGGMGGGGGFFSSMLGGMFGAVAGMWMYDHFFGGGGGFGGSAMGGDSAGDGGGTDTGYSGDGGSYGDDGGGGGGDWGGGGGDWGGGGGDWGGGGDF